MEDFWKKVPYLHSPSLNFFIKPTVMLKTDVIDYFNGDSLAADVWADKYCMKDGNGNPLESSPDDTHRRLAREFARIEFKYFQEIERFVSPCTLR